jgi:general stress protein YciG
MENRVEKGQMVTIKKAISNCIERLGEISVKEAGRRGGCITLQNHGVEFYRKIGRKGGQRTAELYADLLREFGKKGGRPRCSDLNKYAGEEDHKLKEAVRLAHDDLPLQSNIKTNMRP